MTEQLRLPEDRGEARGAPPAPGAACVVCGREAHTLAEVRACLKALGSVPERERPGG